MAHDVFISYATEDRETAELVCQALERAGFRCWIAPKDILPGQDWDDAIRDGIKRSRVVVLVFSAHTNGSARVRKELLQAVKHELRIVPFRIQDAQLSGPLLLHLIGLHWLNAMTPPLRSHLERLCAVVKKLAPPVLEADFEQPPDRSEPLFSETEPDRRAQQDELSVERPRAAASVKLDVAMDVNGDGVVGWVTDLDVEELSLEGMALEEEYLEDVEYELEEGIACEEETLAECEYELEVSRECELSQYSAELPQLETSRPCQPTQSPTCLTVEEMNAQVEARVSEPRKNGPPISLSLGDKSLVVISENASTPCTKRISIRGIVRSRKPIAEIYEGSCKLLDAPLPGVKNSGGMTVNVIMTVTHEGKHLQIEFRDKQSRWSSWPDPQKLVQVLS